MAPNKTTKSKSRPSKTSKKVHRQLSRLYTGIPVISRKNKSDPRPLPTSMSQAIRIMFQIVYASNTLSSTTDYAINLPPNAGDIGTIFTLFDPSAAESTHQRERTKEIALQRMTIFRAAAVRLYGQPLTGSDNVTAYLNANTEYALQSCTLYGPLSQQRETIRLRVDFSTDTPGVAMFDTGDRLKRAVLSTSASRLHWYSNGANTTDTVVRMSLDVPLGSTGATNDPQLNAAMGIFEAVVQIRRSFKDGASASRGSKESQLLTKMLGVKIN